MQLPILVVLIVIMVVFKRVFRSVPILTEPRCAKCNYDLRGYAGEVPTRCSECGADLTARNAIAWGTYRKRSPLWRIGMALIIPFGFLIFVMLGRVGTMKMSPNAPGSPGFSARSNSAVLASLATSVNSPWDWQELERRQSAGTLSQADIGQAIETLITFLKTRTSSQPLNWAENFVTRSDAAGEITDSQYLRLSQAFYGKAKIKVAAKIRAGEKLPIVIQGSTGWQLPEMQTIFALRQVTLADSSQIAVLPDYPAEKDPNYLSGTQSLYAHAILDKPAGGYTLTFTVDSAVLPENTAPMVVGNLPGQASNWGKTRAAWTDVITVPLTILPADQSPIALVTEPEMNPQITGAVKIKAIRVIRKGAAQHVTVDMSVDGNIVPCSFDVFLDIAGGEYAMGQHVASAGSESYSEHSCDVALDPAVQTADVVLRPNATHAEGMPGIDRVWGKTVTLKNISLQRYDLPAK
jgi:hypothetical protein